MIKGLIEKLPLTTILLAYFFICGGLYLIGFWTTFGVDITPFVSLTDIPKSFILPFVLSQGFFLFNLLTNFLSSTIQKDEEQTEVAPAPQRKLWQRRLLIFISIDMLFIYAVFAISRFYWSYNQNGLFWWLSTLTIGFYVSYKFVTNSFVKQYIPYFTLRLYAANVVCLLPFFCFSTGKVLSLSIYHNSDIKYVSISNEQSQSANADSTSFARDSSSSSLKFLGFLGDKLIASSLDNEKIVFLNQSAFDEVVLSKNPPMQTMGSTAHSTPAVIDSTAIQKHDTLLGK